MTDECALPCQRVAPHATLLAMNATLQEIHRDPAILDRAIFQREPLEIFDGGVVTATLVPSAAISVEDARRVMRERFAKQDWEFSAAAVMNRDERNARG